MTKLYLPDTNIARCAIKGSSPAVQRHIEGVQMAQFAISAVTEGELLYGVARRPEATLLHAIVNEFLLRVSVQPWDSNVARHYGTLRAALETQRPPDREPRHDDWRARLGVGSRARHERPGIQPD
jgi:tRNA(fMet)-specific endonuclease VapC